MAVTAQAILSSLMNAATAWLYLAVAKPNLAVAKTTQPAGALQFARRIQRARRWRQMGPWHKL